jgi:hypothetical protein
MSAGDIFTQVAPTINYDCDALSSSKSVFKRAINYENLCHSTSHIRRLEDKVNTLQKFVLDLSNQIHQFKSVVNLRRCSFISDPQSNSSCSCINNNHNDQHPHTYSSSSPVYLSQFNRPYASQPAQMKPFHHFDTLNNAEQLHYLEDAVKKAKAALELREIENINLRKEIEEIRSIQTLSDKIQSDASTSSSQHSRASVSDRMVSSSKPSSVTVPTNTFTATSITSCAMLPTGTLLNINDQQNEMPTRFITERELCASGLASNNGDYLHRDASQILSDNALTWSDEAQLAQRSILSSHHSSQQYSNRQQYYQQSHSLAYSTSQSAFTLPDGQGSRY